MGERLCQLDYQQHDIPMMFASPLPACFVPIGRMMVTVNRYFDEQSENYRKTSGKKKLADPVLTENISLWEMLLWYGQRNSVAIMMVSIGFYDKDSTRLADCIDRHRAESELTLLVFALELYRNEHENRYPADLESLCNGYIEKIPVDPFSKVGESMIYKVNADCTGYLVYSRGVNRTDDGGRNYNDEPRGDDIRRMWKYE